MVVGVKKTIQQVPSRGRISIMRIQHFTVERRQSMIRLIYAALLVTIGMITAVIDPAKIVTNWIMDVRDGSFLFRLYEEPPYQLYCEVWIFNYTNVPQYLSGEDKTMNLQEVGPFLFKEARTNENLTVDRERGVMTFLPRMKLTFVPEQSVSHYRDVQLHMPNLALVAMSTLFADKLGYFANAAAYYSMKTIGSKLFLPLNGEEFLWGYKDPVVTLANTFLPGWIDFEQIGIMDRFYAERNDIAEVELRNSSKKFSINTYNYSPGIKEQGFTDLNSSNLCNRIQGSYEGLMVTPPLSKDKVIPFYRRQACRIVPMAFSEEVSGKFGFDYYRYQLQKTAFSKSSDYACPCNDTCLPEGFIDIGSCYYGFPIALSKPHFEDADPKQVSYFKGMTPDTEKYKSIIDLEPSLGVPLSISFNIQVNVAVRMSPGNPITKQVDGKVLPLIWLSLFCKEPPPQVINLLRMRLVIAPPLIITVVVLLFLVGLILGIQGFHRIWKPKYRLIDPAVKPQEMTPKRRKSTERRLSTVILNMSDNVGFKDDDDMAKQAVSLLAITEEDNDLPDLLITDS